MNNNKKEIWVIYLVLSDRYDQEDFYAVSNEEFIVKNNKKYILYAYTDYKELFKNFKNSRNMNLFKYKHYNDELDTMNVWIYLNDMYPELNLDFYDYNTIDTVGNEIRSKFISIASNDREYETVMQESELIISDSVSFMVDNIKRGKILSPESLDIWTETFKSIFKDNIREALDELDFSDILSIFTGMEESSLDAIHGYDVDILEIFLDMYGNTFK